MAESRPPAAPVWVLGLNLSAPFAILATDEPSRPEWTDEIRAPARLNTMLGVCSRIL